MAKTTVKLYSATISCDSCVTAIESGLREMQGVNSVSVDRDSKMVTVDYDTDHASETDVKRRMKDIGYEVIG
jgi:copper chaperone CopZ